MGMTEIQLKTITVHCAKPNSRHFIVPIGPELYMRAGDPSSSTDHQTDANDQLNCFLAVLAILCACHMDNVTVGFLFNPGQTSMQLY